MGVSPRRIGISTVHSMNRFISIGDITINLSHVEQVVFSSSKSSQPSAILRYSSGRDLTFKGSTVDLLRVILSRISDEEPGSGSIIVTSVSSSGAELDPLARLHNLQKALKTSTTSND